MYAANFVYLSSSLARTPFRRRHRHAELADWAQTRLGSPPVRLSRAPARATLPSFNLMAHAEVPHAARRKIFFLLAHLFLPLLLNFIGKS